MEPSIDPGALPLRDIHLPGPVPWWPPAPGWWLVAAALAVVVAWVVWRHYRFRVHRAALAAVERISADLVAGEEPVRAVQRLSIVLRRFAIASAAGAERRHVPGLAGPDWLSYLDAHGGQGAFSSGPGRWLVEAPYVRPGTIERDEALDLGRLIADWVRAQRNAGGTHR